MVHVLLVGNPHYVLSTIPCFGFVFVFSSSFFVCPSMGIMNRHHFSYKPFRCSFCLVFVCLWARVVFRLFSSTGTGIVVLSILCILGLEGTVLLFVLFSFILFVFRFGFDLNLN